MGNWIEQVFVRHLHCPDVGQREGRIHLSRCCWRCYLGSQLTESEVLAEELEGAVVEHSVGHRLEWVYVALIGY